MVERVEEAHHVFAIDHREALLRAHHARRDFERQVVHESTDRDAGDGVPVEEPSIAIDEPLDSIDERAAGNFLEQLRPTVAQTRIRADHQYRQHESEQALGERGCRHDQPQSDDPDSAAAVFVVIEEQQSGELAGERFDVGAGVTRKEYEAEAGCEDDAGEYRRASVVEAAHQQHQQRDGEDAGDGAWHASGSLVEAAGERRRKKHEPVRAERFVVIDVAVNRRPEVVVRDEHLARDFRPSKFRRPQRARTEAGEEENRREDEDASGAQAEAGIVDGHLLRHGGVARRRCGSHNSGL